jgi:hypothetical protein
MIREAECIQAIIFATGYVARFEFCRSTDAPFDKAPLVHNPDVPQGSRRPSEDLVDQADLEGGHRKFNTHNLRSATDIRNRRS